MQRKIKYITVNFLFCTLITLMVWSCKKKSVSEDIKIIEPPVVIEDTSVPGFMKKLFTTNEISSKNRKS